MCVCVCVLGIGVIQDHIFWHVCDFTFQGTSWHRLRERMCVLVCMCVCVPVCPPVGMTLLVVVVSGVYLWCPSWWLAVAVKSYCWWLAVKVEDLLTESIKNGLVKFTVVVIFGLCNSDVLFLSQVLLLCLTSVFYCATVFVMRSLTCANLSLCNCLCNEIILMCKSFIVQRLYNEIIDMCKSFIVQLSL